MKIIAEIRLAILQFVDKLVDKVTKKAIEIVLPKCCTPYATTVVTCGSEPGLYNVVYTIHGLPNMFGKALYTVKVGTMFTPSGQVLYDESGTITVTDIPNSAGDTALIFYLPTTDPTHQAYFGSFIDIYVGIDYPTC